MKMFACLLLAGVAAPTLAQDVVDPAPAPAPVPAPFPEPAPVPVPAPEDDMMDDCEAVFEAYDPTLSADSTCEVDLYPTDWTMCDATCAAELQTILLNIECCAVDYLEDELYFPTLMNLEVMPDGTATLAYIIDFCSIDTSNAMVTGDLSECYMDTIDGGEGGDGDDDDDPEDDEAPVTDGALAQAGVSVAASLVCVGVAAAQRYLH